MDRSGRSLELTERPLQPAVFLDRDGTINEEVEYLDDPERLRILPGAVEGIRLLNQHGIPVFVVTNQAGVGRGYFSAERVDAVHDRLERELARSAARIQQIDYCPHHPDERCDCRKPNPGMLLRAANSHGLDLRRSFMVGDKQSDVEAGRNAGCRTILVMTGYGADQLRACQAVGNLPDMVAGNLMEAAEWVLEQLRPRSI